MGGKLVYNRLRVAAVIETKVQNVDFLINP
jgi:hypothetical protein